jgi:hypothetical protein
MTKWGQADPAWWAIPGGLHPLCGTIARRCGVGNLPRRSPTVGDGLHSMTPSGVSDLTPSTFTWVADRPSRGGLRVRPGSAVPAAFAGTGRSASVSTAKARVPKTRMVIACLVLATAGLVATPGTASATDVCHRFTGPRSHSIACTGLRFYRAWVLCTVPGGPIRYYGPWSNQNRWSTAVCPPGARKLGQGDERLT